jgi:hypothetical protein
MFGRHILNTLQKPCNVTISICGAACMNNVPSEDWLIDAVAVPSLAEMDNQVLRQAVQANLVSFPSQIPVFRRQPRPDLQAKVVVLYFVLGWTIEDIAVRCGLSRARTGQILNGWRIRAVREGYMQMISPENDIFQRTAPQDRAVPKEAPLEIPHPPVRERPRPRRTRGRSDVSLFRRGQAGRLTLVSRLAEELQEIVSVLENQLRLLSRGGSESIDSCDSLLTHAEARCDLLEAGLASLSPNELMENKQMVWCASDVVFAANQLFKRFEKYVEECLSVHNRAIS